MPAGIEPTSARPGVMLRWRAECFRLWRFLGFRVSGFEGCLIRCFGRRNFHPVLTSIPFGVSSWRDVGTMRSKWAESACDDFTAGQSSRSLRSDAELGVLRKY